VLDMTNKDRGVNAGYSVVPGDDGFEYAKVAGVGPFEFPEWHGPYATEEEAWVAVCRKISEEQSSEGQLVLKVVNTINFPKFGEHKNHKELKAEIEIVEQHILAAIGKNVIQGNAPLSRSQEATPPYGISYWAVHDSIDAKHDIKIIPSERLIEISVSSTTGKPLVDFKIDVEGGMSGPGLDQEAGIDTEFNFLRFSPSPESATRFGLIPMLAQAMVMAKHELIPSAAHQADKQASDDDEAGFSLT
jgi:hypothetical protein